MSQPALKLVGAEPTAQAPEVSPTGRWITAKEASRRSGLNVGTINRSCLEDWSHKNLARRGELPSGQQGWLIDEAADPRFVKAPTADHKDAIFDPAKLGLTDAQTQEVLRRRKIVADWNDLVRASANAGLTERQVTDTYLKQLADRGQAVSRRTLYRWLSAWRRDGIDGLTDTRWKGQREAEDYAPFMAIVTQLYLTLRRRSLQSCYDSAEEKAIESGWAKPSYGHCHRLIGKLDPAFVAIKRFGQKHYTSHFEPSIARDYSSIDTNDWWCSDDTQFDAWVQCGVKPDGSPNYIRPFLHAWEDLRSRKIVAWEISPVSPTAQTVLRTWVNGAVEHGVCKVVYVDNGKTFDSRLLQGFTKKQRREGIDAAKIDGAFTRLIVDGKPIEVVHAWKEHGQSKPIERKFGTMESRFSKLWPTYCGNKPTERPEDLLRKLKTGQAPTIEEFTAAFAEWLRYDYNAKPHRGDSMDGRSPDEVFVATLKVKRTAPRETLEFATFERTPPLVVRKNGLTWKHWQYGQFEPQIARRIGDKLVLAIDDREASYAYACELDGRLICKITANGQAKFSTGVDDQAKRAGIAEKRRLKKLQLEYQRQAPRMALDEVQLALAAARRKAGAAALAAKATGTGDAVPMQIVQTPFDGQLQQIRTAYETPSMRIAPEQSFAPGGFRYHSPTPEIEGLDD